jgi:hypothetical protein
MMPKENIARAIGVVRAQSSVSASLHSSVHDSNPSGRTKSVLPPASDVSSCRPCSTASQSLHPFRAHISRNLYDPDVTRMAACRCRACGSPKDLGTDLSMVHSFPAFLHTARVRSDVATTGFRIILAVLHTVLVEVVIGGEPLTLV